MRSITPSRNAKRMRVRSLLLESLELRQLMVAQLEFTLPQSLPFSAEWGTTIGSTSSPFLSDFAEGEDPSSPSGPSGPTATGTTSSGPSSPTSPTGPTSSGESHPCGQNPTTMAFNGPTGPWTYWQTQTGCLPVSPTDSGATNDDYLTGPIGPSDPTPPQPETDSPFDCNEPIAETVEGIETSVQFRFCGVNEPISVHTISSPWTNETAYFAEIEMSRVERAVGPEDFDFYEGEVFDRKVYIAARGLKLWVLDLREIALDVHWGEGASHLIEENVPYQIANWKAVVENFATNTHTGAKRLRSIDWYVFAQHTFDRVTIKDGYTDHLFVWGDLRRRQISLSAQAMSKVAVSNAPFEFYGNVFGGVISRGTQEVFLGTIENGNPTEIVRFDVSAESPSVVLSTRRAPRPGNREDIYATVDFDFEPNKLEMELSVTVTEPDGQSRTLKQRYFDAPIIFQTEIEELQDVDGVIPALTRIASFIDYDPNSASGNQSYVATIEWVGPNTTPAVVIKRPNSEYYDIFSSHTFVLPGRHSTLVTVVASDGSLATTSRFTVVDAPIPIAYADEVWVTNDTSLNGNVAVNDDAPAAHLPVFHLVTPSDNGTVVLQPNGQFSYIPDLGFVGTDVFQYSIANSYNLTSNVAQVTIRVEEAPQGFRRTFAINEDTTHAFSVANFQSGTTPWTEVKLMSLPPSPEGTLRLNGQDVTVGQSIPVGQVGNLQFIPSLNINGIELGKFRFVLKTNGPEFEPERHVIDFHIGPVNDAPIVAGSSFRLNDITEDQTDHAGWTIIEFLNLSGNSIHDPDTMTVNGIAVSQNENGNGAWQYRLATSPQWLPFPTIPVGEAFFLADSDRVRFVPDSLNGSTATLSFYAWDQTAGSSGTVAPSSQRGGSYSLSTNSLAARLQVTSVNDRPTLSSTALMFLPTIINAQFGNSGSTVADILASSGVDAIQDVDNGAVEGIALVSANNQGGKWQYSLNNGSTWIDVGTVNSTLALLLRSEDRVRFLPSQSTTTSSSIGFVAWDRSQGLAGQKVLPSASAVHDAFSTTQNSAEVLIASNAMGPLESVWISGTTDAVETSITGSFLANRSGANEALTVVYTVESTSEATPGIDFVPLTGTVTFAPGQFQVSIPVTAIADSEIELSETVRVKLLSNSQPNRVINNIEPAFIEIHDASSLSPIPRISIISTFSLEEGKRDGSVQVLRSVDSLSSLTVNFELLGDAQWGGDFTLSNVAYNSSTNRGVITFLPGQYAVSIPVIGVNDSVIEEPVSLELVLLDPTNGEYLLNSLNRSATVDIFDDDSVIVPRITTLDLLNDLGESPYDRKSHDQRVIIGIDQAAKTPGHTIVLEVDHDDDGLPESSTIIPHSELSLVYSPIAYDSSLIGFEGQVSLAMRTRLLDGTQSLGSTDWLDFFYTAETDPQTGPLRFGSFSLKVDSDMPTDLITKNPTIAGRLLGNFSNATVEFDWNQDGMVDHSLSIDHGGTSFERDLRLVNQNFQEGIHTIAYRAVMGTAQTTWQNFTFEYVDPGLPDFEITNLVGGTGTTQFEGFDLSLSGRATKRPQVPTTTVTYDNMTVQLDIDGDGLTDQETAMGYNYRFRINPEGVPTGLYSMNLRIAQWHSDWKMNLFGDWTPIEVDYASSSADVISIRLRNDTGLSDKDYITSDPVLVGRVLRPSGLLTGTVDIDWNGDEAVDQTVAWDVNGEFLAVPPVIQAGSRNVKIRATPDGTASIAGPTANPWKTFRYSYLPVELPTPSLQLLLDTGYSSSDRITTESTLVGNIASTSLTGLEIEVDFGNDGIVDSVVPLQDSSWFLVLPSSLSPGNIEASARVRWENPYLNTIVTGAWGRFSFTLVPVVDIKPSIGTLSLSKDTGRNTSDGITSNASIRGQIVNSSTSLVSKIEVDWDQDNVVDLITSVDAKGQFAFHPTGLSLGNQTIRVRPVGYSYVNSALTRGEWESLSFQLVNATDEPATFQSLGLLTDSGIAGDGLSENISIVGRIVDDEPLNALLVQVDEDGNGLMDSTFAVDESGEFVYTRKVPTLGANVISFRTVEHNRLTGMSLFGSWQSVTVNFQEQTNQAPVLSSLTFAINPHENDLPTITGLISYQETVLGQTIELDKDGDGVVDLSVLTNRFGQFQFDLHGWQEGSYNIAIRSVAYSRDDNAILTGSWQPFSFEYVSPTRLAPTIQVLGLVNDDGAHNNDLITSDPRISGTISTSSFASPLVEIDENNDGIPDGFVPVDATGHWMYAPRNIQAGNNTLATRTKVTSSSGGILRSPWSQIAFEYVTSDLLENQLDVKEIELVTDSGNSNSDRSTSVGAIQGIVRVPAGAQSVFVEFDHTGDGKVDGRLEVLGTTFLYLPTGLTSGLINMQVRAVGVGEVIDSQWKTFRFVMSSDPDGAIAQSLATQLAQSESAIVGSSQALANAYSQSNQERNESQFQSISSYDTDLANAKGNYLTSKSSAEQSKQSTTAQSRSNFLSANAQSFDQLRQSLAALPNPEAFDFEYFSWPSMNLRPQSIAESDDDQIAPPAMIPDYSGPAFNHLNDPVYVRRAEIAKKTYDQTIKSAREAKSKRYKEILQKEFDETSWMIANSYRKRASEFIKLAKQVDRKPSVDLQAEKFAWQQKILNEIALNEQRYHDSSRRLLPATTIFKQLQFDFEVTKSNQLTEVAMKNANYIFEQKKADYLDSIQRITMDSILEFNELDETVHLEIRQGLADSARQRDRDLAESIFQETLAIESAIAKLWNDLARAKTAAIQSWHFATSSAWSQLQLTQAINEEQYFEVKANAHVSTQTEMATKSRQASFDVAQFRHDRSYEQAALYFQTMKSLAAIHRVLYEPQLDISHTAIREAYADLHDADLQMYQDITGQTDRSYAFELSLVAETGTPRAVLALRRADQGFIRHISILENKDLYHKVITTYRTATISRTTGLVELERSFSSIALSKNRSLAEGWIQRDINAEKQTIERNAELGVDLATKQREFDNLDAQLRQVLAGKNAVAVRSFRIERAEEFYEKMTTWHTSVQTPWSQLQLSNAQSERTRITAIANAELEFEQQQASHLQLQSVQTADLELSHRLATNNRILLDGMVEIDRRHGYLKAYYRLNHQLDLDQMNTDFDQELESKINFWNLATGKDSPANTRFFRSVVSEIPFRRQRLELEVDYEAKEQELKWKHGIFYQNHPDFARLVNQHRFHVELLANDFGRHIATIHGQAIKEDLTHLVAEKAMMRAKADKFRVVRSANRFRFESAVIDLNQSFAETEIHTQAAQRRDQLQRVKNRLSELASLTSNADANRFNSQQQFDLARFEADRAHEERKAVNNGQYLVSKLDLLPILAASNQNNAIDQYFQTYHSGQMQWTQVTANQRTSREVLVTATMRVLLQNTQAADQAAYNAIRLNRHNGTQSELNVEVTRDLAIETLEEQLELVNSRLEYESKLHTLHAEHTTQIWTNLVNESYGKLRDANILNWANDWQDSLQRVVAKKLIPRLSEPGSSWMSNYFYIDNLQLDLQIKPDRTRIHKGFQEQDRLDRQVFVDELSKTRLNMVSSSIGVFSRRGVERNLLRTSSTSQLAQIESAFQSSMQSIATSRGFVDAQTQATRQIAIAESEFTFRNTMASLEINSVLASENAKVALATTVATAETTLMKSFTLHVAQSAALSSSQWPHGAYESAYATAQHQWVIAMSPYHVTHTTESAQADMRLTRDVALARAAKLSFHADTVKANKINVANKELALILASTQATEQRSNQTMTLLQAERTANSNSLNDFEARVVAEKAKHFASYQNTSTRYLRELARPKPTMSANERQVAFEKNKKLYDENVERLALAYTLGTEQATREWKLRENAIRENSWNDKLQVDFDYEQAIAQAQFTYATAIAGQHQETEIAHAFADAQFWMLRAEANNRYRTESHQSDMSLWTAQASANIDASQFLNSQLNLPWTQYLVNSAISRRDWWDDFSNVNSSIISQRNQAETTFANTLSHEYQTRADRDAIAQRQNDMQGAQSAKLMATAKANAERQYNQNMRSPTKVYLDALVDAEFDRNKTIVQSNLTFTFHKNQELRERDVQRANSDFQTAKTNLEKQWRQSEAAEAVARLQSVANNRLETQAENAERDRVLSIAKATNETNYQIASSQAYLNAIATWSTIDRSYRVAEATSFATAMNVMALTIPSPWAAQAAQQANERTSQVIIDSLARNTRDNAVAASRFALEIDQFQSYLALATSNSEATSVQSIAIATVERQLTQSLIALIPHLTSGGTYQSPLPTTASVAPRVSGVHDDPLPELLSERQFNKRDAWTWTLLLGDPLVLSYWGYDQVFSPHVQIRDVEFATIHSHALHNFARPQVPSYVNDDPYSQTPLQIYKQHAPYLATLFSSRLIFDNEHLITNSLLSPRSLSREITSWSIPQGDLYRLYRGGSGTFTYSQVLLTDIRPVLSKIQFLRDKDFGEVVDQAWATTGFPDGGFLANEPNSLVPPIQANNARELLQINTKIAADPPELEIPEFEEMMTILSRDVASALGQVSEVAAEQFGFLGSIVRTDLGERDQLDLVSRPQVFFNFASEPEETSRSLFDEPGNPKPKPNQPKGWDQPSATTNLSASVDSSANVQDASRKLSHELDEGMDEISPDDVQTLKRAIANSANGREQDRVTASAAAFELLDKGLSDIITSLEFVRGFTTGVLYDGAWGTATGLLSLGWSAAELAISKPLYDMYLRFGMISQANETAYGKMLLGISKTASNPTVRAIYMDFGTPTGLHDGLEPATVAFLQAIGPQVAAISTALETAWANKSLDEKARTTGRIIGVLIFEVATLTATGGLAMALKAGKLEKISKLLDSLDLPPAVRKTIMDALEEIAKKLDAPVRGLLPHGFYSLDEFANFGTALGNKLKGAGFDDVKAFLQGSAATGVRAKSKTGIPAGTPFDVLKQSDFDIALVSPKLLAKAKELGIPTRSAGSRTAPLRTGNLHQLGIADLPAELRKMLYKSDGRQINFMIYESVEAATQRGLSIGIPGL